MKLFEAEELKKAFVNKGQRSHRYHVGDVWELNFKEICEVLNNMPTVEAIPIEWIENVWLNDENNKGTIEFFPQPTFEDVMEWLIEAWRADNGKR